MKRKNVKKILQIACITCMIEIKNWYIFHISAKRRSILLQYICDRTCLMLIDIKGIIYVLISSVKYSQNYPMSLQEILHWSRRFFPWKESGCTFCTRKRQKQEAQWHDCIIPKFVMFFFSMYWGISRCTCRPWETVVWWNTWPLF